MLVLGNFTFTCVVHLVVYIIYLLDYDGLDVSYLEDQCSTCTKQFSHSFSMVTYERLMMVTCPG